MFGKLIEYSLRLLAQSFKSAKEKEEALKTFLHKHEGPSIVYVQTHDVGLRSLSGKWRF